jgi:hypothetical protein
LDALIFCLQSSCARNEEDEYSGAAADQRHHQEDVRHFRGLGFGELSARKPGDGIADGRAQEPRAHHAAHEFRRRELGDVGQADRRQAQLTEGVE